MQLHTFAHCDVTRDGLAIRWTSDDHTSGVRWGVFPPDVTPDQLSEAGFPNLEGVEIRSAYDCTGRPFSSPARIKRSRTRTLVTQFCGLDI